MPVLYGAPISPFVRKVAVVLEEKGIAYEWHPVKPHDSSEPFSTISPLGKIPAYQDERVALADSSVICFYLERTCPAPSLYPADILELARALWFEEYFDGGMLKPMTAIFNQKWLNPGFLGKSTDGNILKEALETKFPPMLAYLESELKPEQWMAGAHFSIADISLAVGFVNLRWAGYAIDRQRYPKLASYIDRIHARPSFRKCAVFEQAFIKIMKEKSSV